MMNYVCNFYRSSSFDEAIIRKTLSALDEVRQGFFPLAVWRGSRDKLIVERPDDFSRGVIPKEYFIESNVARIPFEGANGTEIVFTESSDPELSPPGLDIEFTERT